MIRPAFNSKAGKCVDCDQWLEPDLFNQDQAKCRTCNNHRRSFGSYLKSQCCVDKYNKLQSSDPPTAKKAFKAFVKLRVSSNGKIAKLSFGMSAFIDREISSAGTRVQAEGEMMWEGEFYEFAATAKMVF